MKLHLLISACFLITAAAHAEERTLTPEQMEQLAASGDFTGGEETVRPRNLPDLTKGGKLPTGKSAPPTWTLGPTGIVGQFVDRRLQGDQILVKAAIQGSPAGGKFLPGDVLIGLNGNKFPTGRHLGELVGNAIISAELPENEGRISFLVWRDRNHLARIGERDVAGVDIDELFAEARDDNTLYDWKPEEERTREVEQMGFDKFPIDPTTLEITLTLRTFPAYADTAPYDCPKTRRILEEAWRVLEKKFIVDPEQPKSGRGGIIEAIALISSGKPEHRRLVRDWVRGKHSPWHPPTEPIGAMFEPGYKGYKGFQSWHKGYAGLHCALYYEATGDDYVLPALRKYAIETAMGQSWAGSWGHTFAYPSFNGGEFHRMNPGYGALNAAGNRCFFLITLARKLGVEHPEIDLAIERAQRFFSSYIDQGCIPYGDHAAYASDDSNGKNTGVAFSLKLLGDTYGAKYFAMMSSHCAFTRRGGHGHDYHGNWSSWAATLCGPEVRQLNERNLRWRRTLCRLHDGSFIYNSPTGGYGALRDPTATEVLHQSAPLKQTLITGKDPDEALHPTGREMKQLLASAAPQFGDPTLRELAGKPWKERGTDEILDLLDIFFPKARHSFAREIGARHQAGEKDIETRLISLLEHDSARFRDGALHALGACGRDTVLRSLSKITPLLDDPQDFVRIAAVKVISSATDDPDSQLAMLEATAAKPRAVAPNSVRNATQGALFGKDHPLANDPFGADFDEDLVRDALEGVLLLDPAGKSFLASRLASWSKDTVVRVAGPLVHVAEQPQIADQMFANRDAPARAMLARFGYREADESATYLLRKKAALPRDVRPFVGFKDPLVLPGFVKQKPAAFRALLEPLETVLIDNPVEAVVINDAGTNWKPVVTPLVDLHALIAAAKKPEQSPSIAADVRAMLDEKLGALDGTGAKIKVCRAVLAQREKKTTFRKIAAMEVLTEFLGADALEDLAPFLGDEEARLRDHSRKLAGELVTVGGTDTLADLLQRTDDPRTLAGILGVFAAIESDAGEEPAAAALAHDDPGVRQSALRTLVTVGGTDALPAILRHLAKARETADFHGCEDALIAIAKVDPDRVRDGILNLHPDSTGDLRSSLNHILARLGDPASLAVLRRAGETTDVKEFADLVHALSYSPSREADKILLDFAATDKKSAAIVGAQSARRLVLGPAGYGDLTNAERMDFAEPMLKLHLDKKLIEYLSLVPDARALRALIYCLKQGVGGAAESLVSNAERLGDLPPADSKIAVKAVRDVIEYIEVTHLRGGIQAHMSKEDNYPEWKALQARAGKALLKLHKPEEAPIPTFDPLDLDP